MTIPKAYSEIFTYVMLPLCVVLFLFGFVFLFLSKRKKEKEKSMFISNVIISVIGIIFGSVFLSMSIAFTVVCIQKIYELQLQTNYQFLLIILYIFPFIPLIFLIFFITEFVKVIKRKNQLILVDLENSSKEPEVLDL